MDIAKMMGQVQQMQAKLEEAKDNLGLIKTSAEAGAGMVKATVNGKKQVVSIDVEADLLRPEDKEMLQDLIVAAINKALQDVEILSQQELKKITEQLLPNMPNIPGLDFGGLK
jgi:DNA-binding YbaB/EbfC family protein